VHAALTLALLLLAGCGQTGALYFDEAPPADQLPPSKKSQPASTIPQPAPVAGDDADVLKNPR
jgi:predicted small lipoprotein YifL